MKVVVTESNSPMKLPRKIYNAESFNTVFDPTIDSVCLCHGHV